MNDAVKRFAEAIAHAEGFYTPNSLPQRCHNPGDLALGDRGFGTARSSGFGASDITILATDQDGWDLLHAQVHRMLYGPSHIYRAELTLRDTGWEYARDRQNWPEIVATRLGVAVTTTLGELASGS